MAGRSAAGGESPLRRKSYRGRLRTGLSTGLQSSAADQDANDTASHRGGANDSIIDRVKELVTQFAEATDAHFPEGEQDWYRAPAYAVDAARDVKDSTEGLVAGLHLDEFKDHLGAAHSILRARMSIESGLSRHLAEVERGSQNALDFAAKNYDSVSSRVAAADQQAAGYLSRIQDVGTKMVSHIKLAHDEHERLQEQVKHEVENHTIDDAKLEELEERRQYVQLLNAKLIEVRAREEERAQQPPVPPKVQGLLKDIGNTKERNASLKKWLEILQKRVKIFDAALEYLEVGAREPREGVLETIKESKMNLRARIIEPMLEKADADNASFIRKQILRREELEEIQASFHLRPEDAKALSKKFREPFNTSGALEEDVIVEMAEHLATIESELAEVTAQLSDLPTLEEHNKKVAQRLEVICSPQRHGEIMTGEAQPHIEVLLRNPEVKAELLDELSELHKELEPLHLRLIRYEHQVQQCETAFEKVQHQRSRLLDFVAAERKSAAMRVLRELTERKDGNRVTSVEVLQRECNDLVSALIAEEEQVKHGSAELDARISFVHDMTKESVSAATKLRGFLDRNRWESEDFGIDTVQTAAHSTRHGTKDPHAAETPTPKTSKQRPTLQTRRTMAFNVGDILQLKERSQLALLSDADIDDCIIDAIHERSRIISDRLKEVRDACKKSEEETLEAISEQQAEKLEAETEEIMAVLKAKLKLQKKSSRKELVSSSGLEVDLGKEIMMLGIHSAEMPLAPDAVDLEMLQEESMDLARDLEAAIGEFKTQIMMRGGHPLEPERVKELEGDERAKKFIADRCRELVGNRRKWWDFRQALAPIRYAEEDERPLKMMQRKVWNLLDEAKEGDYTRLNDFLVETGSALYKVALRIQRVARGWFVRRSVKGRLVAASVTSLRNENERRRLAQMSVNMIRRDSFGPRTHSQGSSLPRTPSGAARTPSGGLSLPKTPSGAVNLPRTPSGGTSASPSPSASPRPSPKAGQRPPKIARHNTVATSSSTEPQAEAGGPKRKTLSTPQSRRSLAFDLKGSLAEGADDDSSDGEKEAPRSARASPTPSRPPSTPTKGKKA